MISLEDLLKTKRMFQYPDSPSNRLDGLLKLIKDLVTPETIMAEIGCFSGVSTELFAMHAKHVYCIDPWLSISSNYIEREHLEYAEHLFRAVKRRNSNLTVIRATSEQGNNHVKEKLDLVYIDGCHTEECVRRDINIWIKKIKPAGWICGHDASYPPVNKILKEYFPKGYITYPDDSWAKQI